MDELFDGASASSNIHIWFEEDGQPVESSLVAGRVYDLCFQVRREEVGPIACSLPEVGLLLSLFGRGLKAVAIPASVQFRLFRDSGSTEVARLAVTVQAVGECKFDLMISTARELELLYEVEVSTSAIAAA
jgi:hypothetical protein